MRTNLEKRPLVVTILAIISFVLGGLCFLVAVVLMAVFSYLITQTGGALANALSSFSVPVFGFKLGVAGLAAFEFAVAIYAIVQGYGLWKLKTWGWWLYIISTIITLPLPVFGFSANIPNNGLMLVGVIVDLVLLWYFVARRGYFNVKLPVITS